MNPFYRPRRSMLYVPGCDMRYLNKARTLRVDSVILDLGDPILVEKKDQSRRNVSEAILAGGYGRREVVVTFHGKVLVFVARHLPRLTRWLLVRSYRARPAPRTEQLPQR